MSYSCIHSHTLYILYREGNRKWQRKREKKKRKRWFLIIDDCSGDRRRGKKTNRQGNTESVARENHPFAWSTILTPLPPSIQLSLSIFRYKCSQGFTDKYSSKVILVRGHWWGGIELGDGKGFFTKNWLLWKIISFFRLKRLFSLCYSAKNFSILI